MSGSISAAFGARYGGAPAAVWTAPRDTALAAIVAYRGAKAWHLVSDGLARAPAPGPELTVLLPPQGEPPAWAFAVLLGAAQTALAVGRPLHAGARMAPGAPLDGGSSRLVALALREDPLVDEAGLLQLVGLTAGEHALMARVGTALVLERLALRDPLLLLDPSRS